MVDIIPPKDPDAVVDYGIDWEPWLASDTIATSVWALEADGAGLTIDSDDNDTTTATVWLSNGTAGRTGRVRNRITTAGGRTQDKTLSIRIRER
jgi:hypothetical protein